MSEKKVCLVCGDKHRAKGYCSLHYAQFITLKKDNRVVVDGKTSLKKTCIVCGNEFVKSGKSVTCSEKCAIVNRIKIEKEYKRKKYLDKIKQKNLKTLKCEICGKEFTDTRTKKTCSNECAIIYKRRYNTGYVSQKRRRKI